jgi:hypothetical protein
MLTIHMHDDGRVQMVDKEQVPHKTRYVALQDMVEAFRGQAMSSPVLPQGCVQYWRGHGYEIVTIYREPHVRKMEYFDDTYDMPVPGTLYAFRIDDHEGDNPQMTESAVFAVAGMWKGGDTQLCGFPYGNVYDEHTICWGELEFETIKLHQLTGMPDMFLSSPYNDDLSGQYQNPDPEGQSLGDFWEDLSGQPRFPNERLVPVCLYSELPSFLGALFY